MLAKKEDIDQKGLMEEKLNENLYRRALFSKQIILFENLGGLVYHFVIIIK